MKLIAEIVNGIIVNGLSIVEFNVKQILKFISNEARAHTHTHTHIYTYIYIYIPCVPLAEVLICDLNMTQDPHDLTHTTV